MTLLESIVQGILQGLAEFLPISSSGHLSVYQHLTGITDGALTATVFLHLGTLAAVFAVFWKKLLGLVVELWLTIVDLFKGKLKLREMSERRRMLFMLIVSCLMLVLILPVKSNIEGLVGDGDIIVEGVGFLYSGVLILVSSAMAAQNGLGKTASNMRWIDSVLIGVAQAIATVPGVSRSGSTISASLMLGCERDYAFDYSFILGTPAVLLATALEVKDGIESGIAVQPWILGVGVLIAAVVGYFAIKLMGKLVRSGNFKYFGYYCLFIAVLTIGAGIYESVTGMRIGALLGLQ